ncbi:MAG TPA: FMN-binding protein [Mobilitalea sp.]|nr:FMN-binding protein [Mobilitalea sp.]
MKNKTKSTLIIDAIALFLITLVSGLALSYVYEITKTPIGEQQEAKKQKANQAVFTSASSFELDGELMNLASTIDLATLNKDFTGITIDEVNKAVNDQGETLGYNIMVTTTQSYKDYITLVFGYSKDGTVQGIEITSISETAGLGMNATKPGFLAQYLHKNVTQFMVTKTGATSDEQIDAISGATITSRAVTNAVNAGIAFINANAADMGGTK